MNRSGLPRQRRCDQGSASPAGGSLARIAAAASPAHKAGDRPYPDAARRDRDAPADRAHRRADDGEPLVRQLLRRCSARRRRLRARRRAAGRTTANPDADGDPVCACHAPSTVPGGLHDQPELGREPPVRGTAAATTASSQVSGPDRDGLLDGGRHPVLLRRSRRTFPVCDRYFCVDDGADVSRTVASCIAGSAFGQVSDPLPEPIDPNPRPAERDDLRHAQRARDHAGRTTSPTCRPPACSRTSLENNPGNVVADRRLLHGLRRRHAAGRSASSTPSRSRARRRTRRTSRSASVYASQVINAVMHSPAWPTTAADPGPTTSTAATTTTSRRRARAARQHPARVAAGDHVRRPTTATGFRVPTVIVSPCARSELRVARRATTTRRSCD